MIDDIAIRSFTALPRQAPNIGLGFIANRDPLLAEFAGRTNTATSV